MTAAFLDLPSFFPVGNIIRFLCWNSFNRQMEAGSDGFRLEFTYFNNSSWSRTLSEEEAIPLWFQGIWEIPLVPKVLVPGLSLPGHGLLHTIRGKHWMTIPFRKVGQPKVILECQAKTSIFSECELGKKRSWRNPWESQRLHGVEETAGGRGSEDKPHECPRAPSPNSSWPDNPSSWGTHAEDRSKQGRPQVWLS